MHLPPCGKPFGNSFDFLPSIFTIHFFAQKSKMKLVTSGRRASTTTGVSILRSSAKPLRRCPHARVERNRRQHVAAQIGRRRERRSTDYPVAIRLCEDPSQLHPRPIRPRTALAGHTRLSDLHCPRRAPTPSLAGLDLCPSRRRLYPGNSLCHMRRRCGLDWEYLNRTVPSIHSDPRPLPCQGASQRRREDRLRPGHPTGKTAD